MDAMGVDWWVMWVFVVLDTFLLIFSLGDTYQLPTHSGTDDASLYVTLNAT